LSKVILLKSAQLKQDFATTPQVLNICSAAGYKKQTLQICRV